MTKVLIQLARLTRIFHPRGTQRLLRLLHDPKTIEEGIQTILTYNGVRIQVNTYNYLEWNLFFLGYAANLIRVIETQFRGGGTFVDVGANVGIISLVAAKRAKEVIAIEPISENVDRLEQNCRLNNFNNVRILQCLVSDQESERTIYKGILSQLGASSLYEDENTTDGIKCDTFTLDFLFKDKKVDFIKIDAEGEDGRILLGARKIIERDRPIITFEHSVKWKNAGVSANDLKSLLEGYKVTVLNGDEICSEILCIPE